LQGDKEVKHNIPGRASDSGHYQSDYTESQRIALTAHLLVAEWEGELIPFPPGDAEFDQDAALTLRLLAEADCWLIEAVAYLRGERMAD
jgi:hypothetical protein